MSVGLLMRRLMLLCALGITTAYVSSSRGLMAHRSCSSSRSSGVRANLFGDLFDNKLKAQEPYERPLLPALVRDSACVYALQEKLFSFSGEDFSVKDTAGDEVIKIEGANVNIGGMVIDKLGFKDAAGRKFCSVERRVVAASTCYDIYSADGKELLCKIEREWLSMTPKYQCGGLFSRALASHRPSTFGPIHHSHVMCM